MSFVKFLGWTAAGVAAVVAAPVTGGGSLAALIGAAGTTSLAGAAIGAAGGAAVGAIADAVTGESKESERKLNSARREAEENKAGWEQSEALRKSQNEESQREADRLKYALQRIAEERKDMLEVLQRSKLGTQEVNMMFMLASLAAHSDGQASTDECDAAVAAVSLLCANPDEAIAIGRKYFACPPSMDQVMAQVRDCKDSVALDRLEFVLDTVVLADEHVTSGEQQVLDMFRESANYARTA